ncbi:MAG: MFS transporter [Rhodobacteraceae bacterium]|nr:MFS transporter [Paracoccaceae bacterium]
MHRQAEFFRSNAPWLMAGFLLTFSSSFGQTFFISIFAGDIRAAFDLSHAGWGGIYALATMSSAAVMVVAGGLTDRFRVRLVGSAVLLGLAVATALMSAAGTLWVLGLTIFLLRFSGQGMMTHAATVAMARWFVATRGRAIAFSGLGFALGEATLPILFVALKGWFDWRTLWLFATATLLLMTGVLLLLLRRERTPQSFAQESRSAGMQGKTWARKDVVRNRLFWLMLPAILGPGAWNTAFFFHQVHFAEAKRWAHIDLVALFPVFTAAGVGSMMLTGVLVDRFGSTRITGLHLLPMAAGYALIGTAQGLPLAALGLALMGIANGAQSTVGASLWAEVYGTANLGRIRAMIGAIMVLGSAIGPGLCGWLIDRGIAMPVQSLAISAYFLFAAVLAAIGARGACRHL